ncbi:hypothetical protein JTE90_017784 [Oedothorax gibbosus]|uniref:Transmembrane protein n=1 Tax=Oedothorax gibbosus TaxID=931172 RepID=A0AAV6UMS7_9ARAC|nr:hypothetical protein JTE90_017784 [Oedothorax gibbosus]
MADSDSGIGCFCMRSCSFCKGSECCCPRCKGCCSNFIEFLKRKFIGLTLVALGWGGVIAAFVLIEDPDWNIAVVPYLCTFAACALVSVTCKRGHYDRSRLVDVCRPQSSRRPTGSDDFLEVLDSELSPLLSGPDREILGLYVDYKPIKCPEDLFEPLPAILREQGALRRNSQVVVQADVHQPVNEPADVPVQEHGEPAPHSPISPVAEASWTASASDPQNSSTPADSGIALQSTGQSSTQSGSAGHIPRPPPPVPVSPISPQQDQPSLFSS